MRGASRPGSTGSRAGTFTLLLCVASFSAALLSCGVPCEQGADMSLGSRLEDALGDPSSDQESVVRLGEMAGADFDRVYAFGPHTTGPALESALGFRWWCAGHLGIEMRDDRSLVAFVRGDRVVKYLYIRTWHGSFDGTLAHGVPRAEAVLRAYTRPDGQRVITKAEVSKEAR